MTDKFQKARDLAKQDRHLLWMIDWIEEMGKHGIDPNLAMQSWIAARQNEAIEMGVPFIPICTSDMQ